jgi:nucleoside-diphosphate-sugar epimerase
MLKIAIIGSDSFIAYRLIKKLLESPFYLITGFGKNKKALSADSFTSTKFYLPDFPLEFANLNSFDVIINCSSAGVQSSVQYSSEIIKEVNFNFQKELVIYLEKINYKGKLITFGSYFEIGELNTQKKISEDELINLKNTNSNEYIESKRLFTNFVTNKKPKFEYFHLILCTIYGNGENINRLIPYLINNLKNGNNVSLTQGTQIRQYIHVDDLIDLILIIINNNITPGIYNVATDISVSIKTLVDTIIKIYKFDSDKLHYDSSRNDTKMAFLELDNFKVKKKTDWEPKITLEEGLKEYNSNGF